MSAFRTIMLVEMWMGCSGTAVLLGNATESAC